MKKLFLIAFFALLVSALSAQVNIQLHYDMGKDRGYLTSTVEMFKPDKYGSTFFFIDMDYNVGDLKGVCMAYWEVARALKFWEAPIAFHTEYNGGLGRFGAEDAQGGYNINSAFLNGIEYSLNSADFSRGLTLQAMHKYIQGKHDASFQLTAVWYLHLFKGKLSFTGFADFWREDNFHFSDGETTKFVFLSEPQLWFNFNKHIAAGGEVEFSSNFGGMKGFHVMPTLGLKFTF